MSTAQPTRFVQLAVATGIGLALFTARAHAVDADIDHRIDRLIREGSVVQAFELSETERGRLWSTESRDHAASLRQLSQAQYAIVEEALATNELIHEQLFLRELQHYAFETEFQTGRYPTAASIERRLKELEALLEEKRPSRDADHNRVQKLETRLTDAGLREGGVPSSPLDLAGVQALLDPDTLLLHYRLGTDRSYVWAVTRSHIECSVLPGRDEIEPQLRQAAHSIGHSHWQRGKLRWAAQSRNVSRHLLEPVAHLLDHRRIVIVADQAITSVAFAALPDPRDPSDSWLVETHEIVYLPSAAALATIREDETHAANRDRIAIFADPVYAADDPRLGVIQSKVVAGPSAQETTRTSRQPLSRLPGSLAEAQAIAAMASSAFVATGLEATTHALREAAKRYGVLHLAAHATFDDDRPEMSGIALSHFDADASPIAGMLRSSELEHLGLEAELVVLSACQTLLGSTTARDPAHLGLAARFLRSGASRVVGSLWDVEDRATSELMISFYRSMLAGQAPAAALRTAQRDLASHPEYAAPYYWAGFVVLGDWR